MSNIRSKSGPAVHSLLLLVLTLFITGCLSTRPEKFAAQVRTWVPLGTSAKEAEKIMAGKHFTCLTWSRESPFNPYGFDYLGCDRNKIMLHDWSVKFFIKDGKVVGYGPMSIDDVTVNLD